MSVTVVSNFDLDNNELSEASGDLVGTTCSFRLVVKDSRITLKNLVDYLWCLEGFYLVSITKKCDLTFEFSLQSDYPIIQDELFCDLDNRFNIRSLHMVSVENYYNV